MSAPRGESVGPPPASSRRAEIGDDEIVSCHRFGCSKSLLNETGRVRWLRGARHFRGRARGRLGERSTATRSASGKRAASERTITPLPVPTSSRRGFSGRGQIAKDVRTSCSVSGRGMRARLSRQEKCARRTRPCQAGVAEASPCPRRLTSSRSGPARSRQRTLELEVKLDSFLPNE